MNITLTGTKITQDNKFLAFEKNNGVDVINITVDTDESWTYKLDVKYPDKCCSGEQLYNIINLIRTDNVCTVVLTKDMLPFTGKCIMQLRGISGDKVYHSDTFDCWVKYSIEPASTYDPVPSEFYQIEQNITEMNNNPPYPSDDGYWMIWNVDSKQYVESSIQAVPVKGAVRYDIVQELTDEQQAQARENIGVEGFGNGDMEKSIYDPNGAVAEAGGIPEYVAESIQAIPTATGIDALPDLAKSGILTPAYQNGTFYTTESGEIYFVEGGLS